MPSDTLSVCEEKFVTSLRNNTAFPEKLQALSEAYQALESIAVEQKAQQLLTTHNCPMQEVIGQATQEAMASFNDPDAHREHIYALFRLYQAVNAFADADASGLVMYDLAAMTAFKDQPEVLERYESALKHLKTCADALLSESKELYGLAGDYIQELSEEECRHPNQRAVGDASEQAVTPRRKSSARK